MCIIWKKFSFFSTFGTKLDFVFVIFACSLFVDIDMNNLSSSMVALEFPKFDHHPHVTTASLLK